MGFIIVTKSKIKLQRANYIEDKICNKTERNQGTVIRKILDPVSGENESRAKPLSHDTPPPKTNYALKSGRTITLMCFPTVTLWS